MRCVAPAQPYNNTMKKITAPLTKKTVRSLRAGQQVLLSGTILTARDQAHKRIVELARKKKRLPLNLRNQIIYYCGPTKTPKGKVVGSCGPTTSSRMDIFTPVLLKAGLQGMIGKGQRSHETVAAIKKYSAIYFLAPAGCGALLAQKVTRSRIVAFKDLGPEAIREFTVVDFPLIVAVDTKGRNVYGSK